MECPVSIPARVAMTRLFSRLTTAATTGSVRLVRAGAVVAGRYLASVGLLISLTGCSLMPWGSESEQPPPQLLANPLTVPAVDREFLWEQLTDAIDDYFEIAHEQRVQLVGNVLMEGRMETHPVTGATIFESWRKDSTPGFERWLSTFQSVRRKAEVRVIPVLNAYQVQVHVFKELEELSQPENSAVGTPTARHDGTLIRPPSDPTRTAPLSLSWIPIGRDISLEQEILGQLQARLSDNGEFAPEKHLPHLIPR